MTRRPIVRGLLLAAASGLAVFVLFARHGVTLSFRATPVRDAETRARVDRLMAEKYGRTDWWYGIVVRTEPIPVRLDPAPAS